MKPRPGHGRPAFYEPYKKRAGPCGVFMVGLVREDGREKGKPIREDDAVKIVLNFMKKRGYRIIPNQESVLTKLRRSKQPRKPRRISAPK